MSWQPKQAVRYLVPGKGIYHGKILSGPHMERNFKSQLIERWRILPAKKSKKSLPYVSIEARHILNESFNSKTTLPEIPGKPIRRNLA